MSTNLWPWIALAGAGVLHGLNPLTGWVLAAWPVVRGSKLRALQLLSPMAAGHLAAVATVAAAVPAGLRLGLAFDARLAQLLAAGLLLAAIVRRFRGHAHPRGRVPADPAAVALWSFIVGLGHGAGWMLLPALASLCTGDAAAREITASGSLLLALGAVGVHMAAMLATAGVMMTLVRRAQKIYGRVAEEACLDRARCGSSARPPGGLNIERT